MTVGTNMIAGKEGWVALKTGTPAVGTEIDLDEWSVDDHCDLILTRSFARRGRQGANPGFLDTTVAFKGYFSSLDGLNPYEDLGFKDGATVHGLILGVVGNAAGLIGAGGLAFFFPSVLVLSCKTLMKADGRVDVDFSGVPQENFYFPGDVIPP